MNQPRPASNTLSQLQKNAVIGLSSVLMALATVPEARVAAQMHDVLAAQTSAQASNPQTSFRLPQSVADGTVVQLGGSSSLRATVADLKQRFEGRFQDAIVDINEANDAQALERLQTGAVEIAAIGRALTTEEKAAGLTAVPMEREKVAIFVSRENPFQGELTFDQFVQIFRGDLQDWEDLGGEGRIRFLDRPATSDTRRSLGVYDIFGGNLDTGETAEIIEEDTTEAVVESLEDDGLGYGVYSQVRNNPNVRIILMHGVSATHPAYPYSQPRHFVYNPETLSEGGRAFLGLVNVVAAQETEPAELIAAAESDEAEQDASATERDPDAVASGADAVASSTEAGRDTEAENATEADGAIATPIPNAQVADTDTPASTVDPLPSEAVHGLVAETVDVPEDAEGEVSDRFPWWVLVLPVFLIGGLWLLLRSNERRSEAAGVVPPMPLASTETEPRIILAARNCRRAYAYWEVGDAPRQQARRQGGNRMALRLYDVTGIDMDRTPPHNVQQFICSERDQDLHLPVAADDRDYVAEIGYTTLSGQWLRLARSEQIHVPACEPNSSEAVSEATPTGSDTVLADGENGTVTPPTASTMPPVPMPTTPTAPTAAVEPPPTAPPPTAPPPTTPPPTSTAAPPTSTLTDPPPATVAPTPAAFSTPRIDFTPRSSGVGYVTWALPDRQQQELNTNNYLLKVRLHDATNSNGEQAEPHQTLEFDCPPNTSDLFLGIEQPEREYWVELGYTSPNNDWVQLARSPQTHFPITPDRSPVDLNGASLATGRQLTSGAIAGAAVAGSAIAGAAATEAALSRPSSTAPSTDDSEENPPAIAKGSTERLRLQTQNHGFPLGTTHRQALQRVAATQALSLGSYKIFIKDGAFDDRPSAESSGEPWVLIWLSGGRVINEKTGVSVSETWSTLNGYADSLVVEVLEPTILHAFFVDTDVKDNESAMTVSIERLPS